MPDYDFKIKAETSGLRLDIFLTQSLPDERSRSFVKKLIDHGHVRVNENIAKANHKTSEGEDVFVSISDEFLSPQYVAPEDIPLDIFYEDEFLFVINKPSGMVVHPAHNCYSGTLVNALLHHAVNLSDVNSDIRPGIVHRLDQETSGLLLIAKDNITHTKLAKQFQRREVKKHYIALVEGDVEFDEGKIDAPIGKHPRYHEKKTVRYDDSAKDALTFYKVLKRKNGVSLVDVVIKTGRTHQIRVHMRHLGHPVLGDSKYGNKNNFTRLALHSRTVGFKHPRTKCFMEFCSLPPKEFFEKVE